MSDTVSFTPDAARHYASQIDPLVQGATSMSSELPSMLGDAMLDSFAPRLLDEIATETGLLAHLLRVTADRVDLADQGASIFGLDRLADATMKDLLTSLADVVGATGMIGDNVLRSAFDSFDALDRDGDGVVSLDELRRAATDRSLPIDVRQTAGALLDDSSLATAVANVSWLESMFAGTSIAAGAITTAGLVSVIEQYGVFDVLQRPGVSDELEAAATGHTDGRLSVGDLEAIVGNRSSTPEAMVVARYLLDHQAAFAWFDQGRCFAAGVDVPSGDTDGVISRADISTLGEAIAPSTERRRFFTATETADAAESFALTETTGVSPRFWNQVAVPLASGHLPMWKPDWIHDTGDWQPAELMWMTLAYNEWHTEMGATPHPDTQTRFHIFRDDDYYHEAFEGQPFWPWLPSDFALSMALALAPVSGRISGRPSAISQTGGQPVMPTARSNPALPRPKLTQPESGFVKPYPGRPAGVPKTWKRSRTKSGDGIIYTDPKNKNTYVRVMPGDPKDKWLNSRMPYVRSQLDGVPLDKAAKNLGSAKSAEAHVPLEIYRFEATRFPG